MKISDLVKMRTRLLLRPQFYNGNLATIKLEIQSKNLTGWDNTALLGLMAHPETPRFLAR